jgi:hypothetical protein
MGKGGGTKLPLVVLPVGFVLIAIRVRVSVKVRVRVTGSSSSGFCSNWE